MPVAQVVVDIPAREIETHFDYEFSDELALEVGSCVLVDFANRPAVGYVVGIAQSSAYATLKPVKALLGGPFFAAHAAECARWMAREYVCPLSEALRLFLPPGGAPKAVRTQGPSGSEWTLKRAGVGPVDERWATLTPDSDFRPKANATMQRAVMDALEAGPLRVAELTADLGNVSGTLSSLEKAGAIIVEKRRRLRDAVNAARSAPRHERLTSGQVTALDSITQTHTGGGGVVVLDGVTGSGKTEVYLRAIEESLARGENACVLVPEISLTPQTVGRFRARFGDRVAVLHSRLSAGERFDQWDLVARNVAPMVVGARSALFAPFKNLKLIIIDEEHEGSYKQSSAPRYHARDVAAQMAASAGATLVLGSASPSLETLERCKTGEWAHVLMPERVTGRELPPVTVVDMGAEFSAGHRSMFSRPLISALEKVEASKEKAVLFLNRRGFASFLLCRECGHVPSCASCSTSMTYHDVGSRLMCHHCGSTRAVPPKCPECDSPYLRQFGAGTQRVEAELEALVPGLPVVRMDADTTKGKGAHERQLASFEALESGILLGTQMIAKGLDYPEVTLVGVIAADVTLNVPDFRAGERTYQLLEQVAGRAGRGERQGTVIIQTYWPDHPALRAAAQHDAKAFYAEERAARRALGYPPFGRLANLLVWGRDRALVAAHAESVAKQLVSAAPEGWSVLGPSPAPLSRLKGVWRWHVLLKAPADADVSTVLQTVIACVGKVRDVTLAVDVDPLDLS